MVHYGTQQLKNTGLGHLPLIGQDSLHLSVALTQSEASRGGSNNNNNNNNTFHSSIKILKILNNQTQSVFFLLLKKHFQTKWLPAEVLFGGSVLFSWKSQRHRDCQTTVMRMKRDTQSRWCPSLGALRLPLQMFCRPHTGLRVVLEECSRENQGKHLGAPGDRPPSPGT